MGSGASSKKKQKELEDGQEASDGHVGPDAQHVKEITMPEVEIPYVEPGGLDVTRRRPSFQFADAEELAAPRPEGEGAEKPRRRVSTPRASPRERRVSTPRASPRERRASTPRGSPRFSPEFRSHGSFDDYADSDESSYYDEPNSLELLKTWQIYKNTDPLKYLTEDWLETGIKKMEDSEEEEEEEEEDEAEKEKKPGDSSDEGESEPEEEVEDAFAKAEREAREAEEEAKRLEQEAEILRKRTVLKKCTGWQEWLRGRHLGSEFKLAKHRTPPPMPPRRIEERPPPEKQGLPRRKVMGKHWLLGPVDMQEPDKLMCWYEDFVTEARIIAESLKFELPVVRARAARRAIRMRAENVELFWHHMEVVDLDGQRQLWSPAFLNYLGELYYGSELGSAVCCSLEDIKRAARKEGEHDPNDLFPRDWSARDEARRQRLGPVTVPLKRVPPQVFKRAPGASQAPELPEFPLRLPWRVPYRPIDHTDGYVSAEVKTGSMLEDDLDYWLRGTEAWEALMGASTGFQRTARAILRPTGTLPKAAEVGHQEFGASSKALDFTASYATSATAMTTATGYESPSMPTPVGRRRVSWSEEP